MYQSTIFLSCFLKLRWMILNYCLNVCLIILKTKDEQTHTHTNTHYITLCIKMYIALYRNYSIKPLGRGSGSSLGRLTIFSPITLPFLAIKKDKNPVNTIVTHDEITKNTDSFWEFLLCQNLTNKSTIISPIFAIVFFTKLLLMLLYAAPWFEPSAGSEVAKWGRKRWIKTSISPNK